MATTRDEALEIADRFVRERGWTEHWSQKRLSVREASDDQSIPRCWLVWCHGDRLPPNETRIWISMDDGRVRRAVKDQGRTLPLELESD